MTYITSAERIGIEKGMQQGEAAIILRQLKHKFASIPKKYEQLIKQADAEILLTWGERILEAKRIEDIFL